MKSLKRAVALALACVMALGGVPSALAMGGTAETYYVANYASGGRDTTGDGSEAKPFLSVQSALDHATGDEVVIQMKSDLEISNILTFGEAGDPMTVTVEGNGHSLTYKAVDDNAAGTETAGIVVNKGVSVTFNGLGITRPDGNQHMTRLLYVKGSVTLNDAKLTNGNLNVSDVENGGSAIHVASGGRVDLSGNTVVSGNQVHGQGASGAVFVAAGGTLNLYSAKISGNGQASKGAGIYVEGTMNVWSDGDVITVGDEVYVEVGATATVGAADGQSGKVSLSRVFLESDETDAGRVATLDIKGETTASNIGIEVLPDYHPVYRLVSEQSDYAIDTAPASMDEAGWSDLDGVRDIRYMTCNGVPGLYFYYHTLDATFHDVGTLTDVKGKDITGADAEYWTEKAVQNTTEAGGVLSVPGVIPVGSGEDYVIMFACDEANKDYRIPRPEVVELTLDGTALAQGTDYEYVPNYADGTATLTVKAAALEGKSGVLDFGISAEKYSLLTLAMNGPVYTMATDVTGQSVTKALSVQVEGSGAEVSYLVTRDGSPVEGVSVILYREGTSDTVGTQVTDAEGKARFAGLDPARSYYYVLYYTDSFHVIAADKMDLTLSTLQGQHLDDRCEFDAAKADVSYTVVDAENFSKSTSVIKDVTADTTVTYYVDLARDEIVFQANQGEATTADTATFTGSFLPGGTPYRGDSVSKHMETNVATYGELPGITMTGYDFVGWFTAAEGGTQVESGTAYDTVESPKTLYAHWAPRNDRHYKVQHWVEFTDDGTNATYVDGTTETKTADGKVYYLWSTVGYDDGLADSVMDNAAGYALADMAAGTAEHSWWKLDGFDMTAQQDCKVLADGSSVFCCYYDRKPYVLTYDPAPGAMTGEATTQDCKFGVNVGTMLEATRSGYNAGGWYYDVDGDETRDENEAVVTPTSCYTWTGDITVRQQWVNSDTTYVVKLLTEDLSRDEFGLGYADGSYTVYTVKSGIPGTSDVEAEVSLSSIEGTSLEGFTYVGYSTVMDETGVGMTRASGSFLVTPDEVADATVVYLYYDRNEVVVSFMADDTGDKVFKPVTVAYGDTFEKALPKPEPTKPGYKFTGWVDVPAGNAVTDGTRTDGYAAGGSGSLTVRPTWEARQYLLTYVPGDKVNLDVSGMGTGVGCNSDTAVPGGYVVSKPVTYGQVMGAMPVASKTCHEFLGWALEGKDGYVVPETVVSVDNVIVENAENTVEQTRPLYAQFKAYTFNLALDAGLGTVTPAGLTVTYGEPIPALPTPVRDGYSFNGWAYDMGEAGQTRIESGDIWTYEATDGATVTAHALWQPLVYSYRLHLNDVDEGNGSTKAVLFNSNDLSVDVTFGTPYAKVLDGVAAQRNGYKFLGWSLSRDLGDLITDETVNGLADDADVYAMWQPNAYKFVVDLKGGVLSSEDAFNWAQYAQDHYAAYKTAYGTELKAEFVDGKWNVPVIFDTVYGVLEQPVRENYLFEGYKVGAPGWFDGEKYVMDGKVVKAFDVSYTDNADAYITLDAVWTPYFDFVRSETDTEHVLRTDLETAGALPEAAKDGYTFLGWWDDVSGQYVTLEYVLGLDEYRSFRAVFTPNVTFDANGGKVVVDGQRLDSFTIGLSELMDKYDDFFTCEKAGSTFMGWVAEDGSDMSQFHNLASHGSPVKLTATYDVTVTFCLPNNATWDGVNGGSRTYTTFDVGQMAELPKAYLSGYEFLGWFDVQTADGVTTRQLTAYELSTRTESSKVYAVFGTMSAGGIDVTVTNYGSKSVTVTEPAGWVKGQNTFSVQSELGCVVALHRDGVYTLLTQKRADGNVHTFVETLQDGDEIVVLLRGDVDLNGRVSVTDASVLDRYLADNAEMGDLVRLAGDADINGRVSVTDSSSIARALAYGQPLGWAEP